MAVIGHCLIWHSQLAPWFCVDSAGKNVSPEVLKQRMKEHISTIVGRYKGRIHGWDVVNEAIMEDGSYRKTKFYEILGKEYIPYAFQCAHEADPEAELYYNDYGMNVPGRRDSVAALVRSLKEKGTASMPSACRDIWAWTIPRWKTLRRACSPLQPPVPK